jgi:hypothetical protein
MPLPWSMAKDVLRIETLFTPALPSHGPEFFLFFFFFFLPLNGHLNKWHCRQEANVDYPSKIKIPSGGTR